MSTSKALLELLEKYDFKDLENYPNVGINRKDKVEEFSYSGNFFLRNRNARLLITPDAVAETEKCAADFFYFAEHYIKIETIDKGIVPFTLRDWQIDTVKAIDEFLKIVLNVARQSGKSTVIVAYILWLLVFEGDLKYGIVANKSELTSELMTMLKNMYMLLPPFLQHNIIKWNARSIELSNGGKVVSAVAGPSALRGQTISFLLCLSGDTEINVLDTSDDSIINTTMEELYNLL